MEMKNICLRMIVHFLGTGFFLGTLSACALYGSMVGTEVTVAPDSISPTGNVVTPEATASSTNEKMSPWGPVSSSDVITPQTAISPTVKPTLPKLSTEAKEIIAEEMLGKFKQYIPILKEYIINDMYTWPEEENYNYIMAKDLFNGLTGVYKACLNSDDLDFVQENITLFSVGSGPIYSGYTETGVHIIALKFPDARPEIGFMNVMDKIAQNDNEGDMLFNGRIYNNMCIWDIYVEDLQDTQNVFDISITVRDMDGGQWLDCPVKEIYTNSELSYFCKYNRTISNDKTIANKTWKLYLTESNMSDRPGRSIWVTLDGETVELQ